MCINKGMHLVVEDLQVDINTEEMMLCMDKCAPLLMEYVACRKTQLVIEGYDGSVDTPYEPFVNMDAVVCVELIEHLYPDTEMNLPYNVFGYIKPKIIIFTTPNSDFNVLFGKSRYPNGFRHDDHKFEWDRQQFRDWALNLCERYPNYKVNIAGVGKGPAGKESVGECSQIACFVRRDLLEDQIDIEEPLQPPINASNACDSNVEVPKDQNTPSDIDDAIPIHPITKHEYKLLFRFDYPFHVDNRTDDEIILDEAQYFVNRNMCENLPYYNYERDIYEFPVDHIYRSINEAPDIHELRVLLRQKFVINDKDEVEVKPPEESEDENDYSIEDATETNSNQNTVDVGKEEVEEW